MAAPEKLNTPKGYWITRRSEGHSDWALGFWRELFQNAVDAGATKVDITLDDAPGKGSFGRPATLDRVVRVTFSDDGRGMDERILRDVFLKPGETTKRSGDTVGGFGTARIMLAFSQVRYAVRTQDWLVEGDGSEFTCLTMPQAAEAKRAEIDEAVAAGHADRAEQLRADLAFIMADQDTRKGCKLEIDVDPKETPWNYRNVDKAKLLAKLDEYLSLSQVPCKVRLNGEELTTRTLRGPARRKLVATMPDGATAEFATVHTSQGEKARHKSKVVVRVNGAAMFSDDVQLRDQVIVELDPAFSRQALTDNRDGLKDPFRSALAAFLRELAVDTKSALQDKDKRKHIKIEGGKGALVARPVPAVDLGAAAGDVVTDRPTAAPKARYATREEYEVRGYGGAPRELVDSFLKAVKQGDDTFLEKAAEATGKQEEARGLREAVRDGRGADALREVGPALGAAIADTLVARAAEAERAAKAEEAARFAEMNDVHIQIDDIGDDEKLKNAVRRHSPGYWRRKGQHLEGRGMQAHMLLAAWTACCQEAVDVLLRMRPDLAEENGGEVRFSTGWYFGKPTRGWNGREYGDVHTGAQHQKRDGVHLLLLNPVAPDGSAAFDLTKARREPGARTGDRVQGIQDLEMLAIHEVSHMLESTHDEGFASVMTEVASMFDRAKAHARMRDAVDAVREAYGRGKARIQAMDGEEAVAVLEAEDGAAPAAAAPAEEARGRRRAARPAEKLLAHAAPIATMVAGAAAAQGNEHVQDEALQAVLSSVIAPMADGVAEVDCEALASFEKKVEAVAANGWSLDLAALDLPPVEEMAELGSPAAPVAAPAEAPPPAPAPVPRPAAPTPSFDLGSLELPPADQLLELGAAPQAAPARPEPVRAPAPRPAAPAQPSLEGLREFGAELAALGTGAPAPAATPVAQVAEPPRPVPAAPAAPARAPSPMDLLREFSDELSTLGGGPRTPAAPAPVRAPEPVPVVVDAAARAVALVGEEFSLDGFEEAPAPRF